MWHPLNSLKLRLLMRGEERRVTDESRDPGLSSVSRSPSSDEPGPGHWPPATLGPPVSTVQCVQCSTHCTVVTPATSLHPQSPSVCQQLWKQPDVSYKVTEKLFLVQETRVWRTNNIWLRSESWMTLMKNFICGYLDRDNHHDIVSIFWLGKKMFAQKIYPAQNTFEMRAMVTSG